MRYSLMPLLLPPSIMGIFTLGLYQFITNRLDRNVSLALTIGAVLAAAIAIALYVYTVENRLREIETRIDHLMTLMRSTTDKSDAEQAVRIAFGLDQ